jgi:hypothetical protein
LRELWNADISATRIGAELGFTKNAITARRAAKAYRHATRGLRLNWP